MKTQERRSVEQKSNGENKTEAGRLSLFRRCRHMVRLVAVLASALVLVLPNAAWADPSTGLRTAEGAGQARPDVVVITREVTYDQNTGQPDLPELIEEDGYSYRIFAVSDPRPADGAVHQRNCSGTIEGDITVAVHDGGAAAQRAAFPAQMGIDQDGFRGAIGLAGVSTEPVYVSYSAPVERQLIVDGLTSADITGLPESYVFTVSSDEYLGATTQSELQRLSVTTEVSSYAADGRPESYTAILVFRGIERVMAIDRYHATAYYEGVVQAVVQLVTVTVSYEREVLSLPPAPVEPPVAEQVLPVVPPISAPAADPGISWTWLIAGALVVIVLAVLPLAYYWLKADARLVKSHPDGSETLLVARRLRINQSTAVFAIPESFNLSQVDAGCSLKLSGRRYKRALVLEIHQGTQKLYQAKPEPSLEIGKFIIIGTADVVAIDDDEATAAA